MLTDSDKDFKRIVDISLYITCLAYSSFQLSRNKEPFNFNDFNTCEYLMNRNLPFIENPQIPYKEAHDQFLKGMFQAGWSFGTENFAEKTHPDLVPWEHLEVESKKMIAFSAAVIESARNFYETLKCDMESDFMDCINLKLQGIFPANLIQSGIIN